MLTPANSQIFGYDNLQRLTDATGAYGDIDYTYDTVGNRLSRTHFNGASTISETYSTASSSNRLLSVSKDDNGILTTRSLGYSAVGAIDSDTRFDGTVRSLSYNNRNRLSSVSDGSGLLGSYTYNALGQRVVKLNGSGLTHYHYDFGGRLIAESDPLGNVVREYIFDGANLRGIFRSGGTLEFVHTDHLGTPQAITDATATVTWSGSYLPFGEVAQVGVSQPIRFPGQVSDSETGYSYNYFRDYDPSIGRYLKSDPIGLEGGLNRYGYALQNPLKYVDPRGLDFAVIENGPTDDNPIGHSAIAITGAGVFSFGNGTQPGSSLRDYVLREAPRRDTRIYIVSTTPDQDKAALEYLSQFGSNLPGPFLRDLFVENCSTRTNGALGAAGIFPDVPFDPMAGPGSFPSFLPGTAGLTARKHNPVVVEIPRNSATVPPQLGQFEPRD